MVYYPDQEKNLIHRSRAYGGKVRYPPIKQVPLDKFQTLPPEDQVTLQNYDAGKQNLQGAMVQMLQQAQGTAPAQAMKPFPRPTTLPPEAARSPMRTPSMSEMKMQKSEVIDTPQGERLTALPPIYQEFLERIRNYSRKYNYR